MSARHPLPHRTLCLRADLPPFLILARPPGGGEVWLSDITYVWTKEGWLYLAAVEDLYTRKIVGWSMRTRIVGDSTDKRIHERKKESR